MNQYIIKISLPDRVGLIYEIAKSMKEQNLNIDKSDEFVDDMHKHFFMRLLVSGETDISHLKSELHKKLNDADIEMHAKDKKDIILFATKESHCLGDILLRYDSGELNANIQAVISNHNVLRKLSERFEIPFFYISSEDKDKQSYEDEMIKLLEKYQFSYIILAKYMRILSPRFVKLYENKIINIHHSFLPAFVGANPYKQAYERGVKIIGATAHFVNDNLDEGPIILQDTMSVNHTFDAISMARAGRDIEKITLSNALNLALEDRIFIYQNKTIVF